MIRKLRIRRLTIAAAVTTAAVFFCIPLAHLGLTLVRDQNSLPDTQPGYANDASRLDTLPVQEIWTIPESSHNAEQQLIGLLAIAHRNGLKVSVAGARHSMGGHTIALNGIVINMLPFKDMSLSADGTVLTVQAGALWEDVIPFLDRHGRSVAIMQSDNSFSVGGSLSVNVHGWQAKRPPISASVKSFRLLMADGRILRCSREENTQLFSLALGGYGLFGIILDAELRTVPNEWYEAEGYAVPIEQLPIVFREQVDGDETVEMVYGRVRLTQKDFLEEAILTVYRKADSVSEPLPPLSTSALDPLRRIVFRGSVGSDYGKQLRWNLEKIFGEKIGGKLSSRNQLLNGNVALYTNRAARQTDILHEYFVPLDQLPLFLQLARQIIPHHNADLLNVTLRDIREDSETFLRYADRDLIAVVMFFNQPDTKTAEENMQKMTQTLIDAAFSVGGRYYLPYRPHATPEQFLQAYPQAREFAALKRLHDSGEIFSNQFYLKYLSQAEVDINR